MTASRTALVTGANQGLGRALVEGLAAGMDSGDRVLLTGRDPGRVADAVARIGDTPARVEGRVLDVREPAAIVGLAEELEDGVDIVFANACARTTPDQTPRETVDATVETNNLATTRMLRAFAPILRPGGRFIVVASSFGTLGHLDPRVRPRFRDARTLEAVEEAIEAWRVSVLAGTAEDEGWPAWLNVPSQVARVAAVRAVARPRRDQDLASGTLVAAICPGLIDTDTSRPWFTDMSQAQSPADAARAPLQLALSPAVDPAHHGELVRFGRVLGWEDEIVPEASAGARVSRID